MKKCKITDCDNYITKGGAAKGYCSKHYTRLRRYKDPLKTTRFRKYKSIKEFINLEDENVRNTYIFTNNTQWSIGCKLYYGDACCICGWNLTTCDVNHIIPKSRNGLNTITNGEVLCPNCHALKHRQLPIEQRKYIT